MKREHIGSDFDGFLKEDGLLAECEAAHSSASSPGSLNAK